MTRCPHPTVPPTQQGQGSAVYTLGLAAGSQPKLALTVSGKLGVALPSVTHSLSPGSPTVTSEGSGNFDALIGANRTISGHASGSSMDSQDTLAFSALSGVRPTIETVPLERAAEAYDKMMRNEARFRMVLTTGA